MGETPIAGSIIAAVPSFSKFKGQNNRIVLITDGIEECGGDVCAAAAMARDAGIGVRIDVVGFALDAKQRAALSCISTTTGGVYYDAIDSTKFAASLASITNSAVDGPRSYSDSRGKNVVLPLGDRSFVDRFVSADLGSSSIQYGYENPEWAIGPPQHFPRSSDPSLSSEDKKIYSLGCGGTATWRFVDNVLVDKPGDDIYVYETLLVAEPTRLEISENGTDWVSVGEISGGNTAVDISPKARPGARYRYVKLTDLRFYCGPPEGADIDAIAAISSEPATPEEAALP